MPVQIYADVTWDHFDLTASLWLTAHLFNYCLN
jgi:hypothetical protein